ncbi:MAG: vWA domain-containing protein [Candidatus Binatus sp.]|uniref:vWA domain-containing protein n=1 Tax=Candidatus Binatus sp. TaxID=2811406 RepID=UPI002723A6AB|nr:vWA domain-containing protein [Candidatus Binatus sp.]MDO8431792.1 vWA domain-containing protein [Candidatus Binatus sp.]
MIAAIVILLVLSTFVVAFIFYRILAKREREAEVHREEDEADATRLQSLKDALGLLIGPFPLSVALHVIALLFLIITVHEQRGRELIMVNLEAGGGGGGGNEMQDLDMPEVPMPDTQQQMEAPTAVDTSQAVGLANDYVRAAGGGGIGIGRGGGMGSGYGHGVGSGFGGFIGELRRKGLDVVLVIDGTGSMKLIIDDVKAKMGQLVQAIHRLVPIARVGIVVFGGKGEKMSIQPLTLSPQKMTDFLSSIQALGGGEWEEDTFGAVETAIDKMDWKPYAKKVVVLVGDSPPKKDDFGPLLAMIRKFKGENGTFNTVDVAAEEHERFEREFWLKVHREEPPKISPLPEFYRQTQAAYKVLAVAGGGSMKSLTKDSHINQQVLILAFGEQWQSQVAAFGRGLAGGSGSQ